MSMIKAEKNKSLLENLRRIYPRMHDRVINFWSMQTNQATTKKKEVSNLFASSNSIYLVGINFTFILLVRIGSIG